MEAVERSPLRERDSVEEELKSVDTLDMASRQKEVGRGEDSGAKELSVATGWGEGSLSKETKPPAEFRPNAIKQQVKYYRWFANGAPASQTCMSRGDWCWLQKDIGRCGGLTSRVWCD